MEKSIPYHLVMKMDKYKSSTKEIKTPIYEWDVVKFIYKNIATQIDELKDFWLCVGDVLHHYRRE